jgi:uncharacterized protein (UPF0335 family)
MSEPQAGHNGQLKSIVERIENVESEIKDLQGDRGEIYQEAKSSGYDVKTLRKVIAIRKKDPSARAEEAALLDTYMTALGMES